MVLGSVLFLGSPISLGRLHSSQKWAQVNVQSLTGSLRCSSGFSLHTGPLSKQIGVRELDQMLHLAAGGIWCWAEFRLR